MIGILFPDKKSAIAIGVSQKLQCKSSFLLKGLTYLLGVLMIQLKRDENDLKDFNSFCDYFISYKNVFSEHISPDLQKTIIEILLLNDVLKSDTNLLFSDSFEESEELEDQAFSRFLKNKILLIFISIVLIGSLVFYLIRSKSENTVNIDDTEEIIPIDSLNKLNDSLTQVAVDSTKLQSDSTVSLFWTNGKSFTIPKQSTIVSLHTFLTDSTVKDPITLNCFEVTFENESDQILSSKDYFFKRFSEGLQLNKDIKLEILTFSDKDSKSALKRGFFIKNRFVGEGISPKRISVVPSIAGISPDANVPLNAQVVFRVLK
jgi:hypothetical protein